LAGEKERKFKGKFRAEFSMGQLDYERYDAILRKLNYVAVQCRAGRKSFVFPFYALLKELWIIFQSTGTVYQTEIEAVKVNWDELETMMKFERRKESIMPSHLKQGYFPFKSVEKIEELYVRLMEIKQMIGLGIQIERTFTDKSLMKRGMGLDDA